jgi:hypothetical protein
VTVGWDPPLLWHIEAPTGCLESVRVAPEALSPGGYLVFEARLVVGMREAVEGRGREINI